MIVVHVLTLSSIINLSLISLFQAYLHHLPSLTLLLRMILVCVLTISSPELMCLVSFFQVYLRHLPLLISLLRMIFVRALSSSLKGLHSLYHFLGPPVPPAYEADIVQGTDSSTLNSIYIFLMPSFTPLLDMEYVEVYEDERLYVIATDQMVDECMVYCHCNLLYNVPASSAKDGVHPPFFIVTRGHYIGVFCGQ